MELTLHAPAKVNLTLIVGARRDDGYHDVSTVMQTVGLYDTLTLTEGGSGLTMTCTDPDLPTDGSNLVLRAAALFCRELHLPVPDLHLHLQKRIPSQAGLGGGSSDAAAVLRALRRRSASACCGRCDLCTHRTCRMQSWSEWPPRWAATCRSSFGAAPRWPPAGESG